MFLMYDIQMLVGVGFSYGIKFTQGASHGAGTIDIQTIGMTSVLVGGAIVLLWAWTDICRFGPSFSPQIGLRPTVIKTSQAVILIFLLLSATHFSAWAYRSVLLPLVGR